MFLHCDGKWKVLKPILNVLYVDHQSAPGKLGTPTVTTITDSSITLTWTIPLSAGSAPLSGFVLYMSYNNGTTFEYIQPLDASTTRYNVEALMKDTPYVFALSAVNSIGEGPLSDPTEKIVTAAVPPGPPPVYFFYSENKVTYYLGVRLSKANLPDIVAGTLDGDTVSNFTYVGNLPAGLKLNYEDGNYTVL